MSFQALYPSSPNAHSVEDGHEFEDFARDVLISRGIIVHTNKSAKFQIGQGENPQGIEFKRDNWCTKTRRLSIEYAEKRDARNQRWADSGILVGGIWLYVQGNESAFYVFGIRTLRNLYDGWRAGELSLDAHDEPTVRAFYLPFAIADSLCDLKYPEDFENAPKR
jgi:hypothetical protein